MDPSERTQVWRQACEISRLALYTANIVDHVDAGTTPSKRGLR